MKIVNGKESMHNTTVLCLIMYPPPPPCGEIPIKRHQLVGQFFLVWSVQHIDPSFQMPTGPSVIVEN